MTISPDRATVTTAVTSRRSRHLPQLDKNAPNIRAYHFAASGTLGISSK
jgi:hypothetical protein